VSLWEIEPLTPLPMYPSPCQLMFKCPWPTSLHYLHGGQTRTWFTQANQEDKYHVKSVVKGPLSSMEAVGIYNKHLF